MKKLLLLTFLAAAVFMNACHEEIQADTALSGEWAYVGNFDHRTDVICMVCPGFKYDSSLYKLTFHADRTITGKVNLLNMGGYYVTSEMEKAGKESKGTIKISKFNATNKPYETEKDIKFQQDFRWAMSYHVSVEATGLYDFLSVQYNENEYLFFVRKKK
ncbi:hypothetical protein GVN16_16545 [Emticicia sp. CRIBPO]|uniref:hypothetical protein n=1 Tax=Emticicia sp. CRIBPO TaxID=2683258 RepID=UPI001411F378|nr:hypothetical protein [Emticicia sp. CRIBPO]NBA87386.1 hypothetical protein [Emticicia sp. CRIBPO]